MAALLYDLTKECESYFEGFEPEFSFGCSADASVVDEVEGVGVGVGEFDGAVFCVWMGLPMQVSSRLVTVL